MKRKYVDVYLIIIVAIIYCINSVLKKYTTNIFIRGYLNDSICPIAFMAYTNIILKFFKCQMKRLFVTILYCFGCGLFWEFASLNPNSVSDINDIFCYLIGGAMYWIIKYKCFVEKAPT